MKGFHIDGEYFDPQDTLECGQVFRYTHNNDGSYTIISTDKKCIIQQSKIGGYDFVTDNPDYFYNYFDFNTDYSKIREKLKDLPLVCDALDYGKGVRILRQDTFETIISFIISANNHIPRIKGIIERLCQGLGENKGDYYAFPTAEKMAAVGQEYYKDLGAGYRDKYLDLTSKAIAMGEVDIDRLNSMSTESARKELCKLMGIGGKVADCILQFGMGRMEVFPTDTWIKKMYAKNYGENDLSGEQIRNYLVSLYGEYSGYAQQYIFYAERAKLNAKNGK